MYGIQNYVAIQVYVGLNVSLRHFYLLRRAGLGGVLRRVTKGFDGTAVRLACLLGFLALEVVAFGGMVTSASSLLGSCISFNIIAYLLYAYTFSRRGGICRFRIVPL